MSPRSLRLSAALVASVSLVIGCAGPSPSASPTSGSTATPAATQSAPPASAPTSPTPSESATPTGPFDPASVSVALEPVVGGLDSPLAITHAGDGSGRVFVAEQGGAIRIVRDGALVDPAYLDISDRITAGGERGLLGIAFHPDYPADPRVFVDYTNSGGDTRISSFTVDPANPDRANPDSEVELLAIGQPYSNHNGGALAFGPDGYLYISLGDGGSGGDPHGYGQALDTLLGKIVRIDVDGTLGALRYAIPPDNPLVGKPGQPEIFAFGMRNPWRMSFDRSTGDLWIGDVGQGRWEEIDVVRSGTSGQNFGWNRMEGAHCFRPAENCDTSGLTGPVAEYPHDSGCTVIGGVVYRGSQQGELIGGYVFADYCSGRMWAIDPAVDGQREPVIVAETGATLSSFGEDEAGELFATDLSSGELLRVVAAAR